MPRKREGDQLRRSEKVVAAVDLVGVPAGTPGRVILVDGFRWVRYRVLFDNGLDVGSLDRSQLATRAEWRERAAAPTDAGERPVPALDR
jgi:hypothetical protein